jgi:hypothetical protein
MSSDNRQTLRDLVKTAVNSLIEQTHHILMDAEEKQQFLTTLEETAALLTPMDLSDTAAVHAAIAGLTAQGLTHDPSPFGTKERRQEAHVRMVAVSFLKHAVSLIENAEAGIRALTPDAERLADAAVAEGPDAVKETLADLHSRLIAEWNPVYWIAYAILNRRRPETRH